MVELKGIAWDHTRGFAPVVTTAQRYEELHPDVRISWVKRSLQAFADASMQDLASEYDLIVMDHPHTAIAATEGINLPLDQYLTESFLEDQAANSVGGSHSSYSFDGHQWTLAIDAAAPIATWRPDLFEKFGLTLPETWDDVLDLSRKGYVSHCLLPLDSLMLLYSFTVANDGQLFVSDEEMATTESLESAFELLRETASLCTPRCLERNPIATAEHMTQSDDPSAAYCPHAYGYSNYSREGYARRQLKAGNLVEYNGRPLRSVLGGAGLAVSSKTKNKRVAADYARFTASPGIQKGLYFESGGQPGHRGAWTDERVNGSSLDFFKDTLDTLDDAIMRPRYSGYMYFQDNATPIAHDCISGNIGIKQTIRLLNKLYQESKTKENHEAA